MYRLRLILIPFSFIFYLIIKIKNFLYDKNFIKIYESKIPVICIGNLSTGGTGKTPVLISITEKLLERNNKIAILSRGYKRSSKGFFEVTHNDFEKFGDEPVMIKNNLKNADMFVCEDRVKAVKEISERKSYDYILMDDGFQYRKLLKNFSILVLDKSQNSYLNNILLPAGNLRETKSSLKNTDVIVYNYKFISSFSDNVSDKKIIISNYVFEGLYNSDGKKISDKKLTDYRFFAFCGIGLPESFFSMLEKNNYPVIKKKAFSDHFRFNDQELENIIQNAKENDCNGLLTTEKDYYRLVKFLPLLTKNAIPLYFIKIRAEIKNIDKLISIILEIKGSK